MNSNILRASTSDGSLSLKNLVFRLCSRGSGSVESRSKAFGRLLLEFFSGPADPLRFLEEPALFLFVVFFGSLDEIPGPVFLSLSSIGGTPPERKLCSKLRTALLTSGKPCCTLAVNVMSLKFCSFTVSKLLVSCCDDPSPPSVSLD